MTTNVVLDHCCLWSGICKRKLYTEQVWLLTFNLSTTLLEYGESSNSICFKINHLNLKKSPGENGLNQNCLDPLLDRTPFLPNFLLWLTSEVIWDLDWSEDGFQILSILFLKNESVIHPPWMTEAWFKWIFLQNSSLETLNLGRQ